ncbi:MAG: alpha-1,4-glucan--maltose-1-phosphate maltosyltransferase [Myxococcota bacterium]
MTDLAGASPIVFFDLQPEVDCGRFPVKRCLGDVLRVEVDIVADGHDVLAGDLLWREVGTKSWHETPLGLLGNDRWGASFQISALTTYEYTVNAWIDDFGTWLHGFERKLEAGQVVTLEAQAGQALLRSVLERIPKASHTKIQRVMTQLDKANTQLKKTLTVLHQGDFVRLMRTHGPRTGQHEYGRVLQVIAQPPLARFGAWYEMFPRSAASTPGKHGTLRDVEARLPYVQSMGFDVLYLPPIHPIGQTHRKGKNNTLQVKAGDVGSPWAIGSAEGGHTAIHADLGSMKDLRSLVRAARARGIEIALDIAFQCSPDHPWVKEHPEFFKRRVDGSIQYAENPPKKYQDIYPLNFHSSSRVALCEALTEVVLHWVRAGIRVFRVDNPHTKPLFLWEYLIAKVRKEEPQAIFLAEAFTRPKLKYALAKVGFDQGYTYFTWRQTPEEMRAYVTELFHTSVHEFFCPNFWPNTPDILPEHLQSGGRPAFMMRLVLAGTLSASYGIYGPAFELCENKPMHLGSEEYLHSEKYEIRTWDLNRVDSLRYFIARLNAIRKEHAALHDNRGLRFHGMSNDRILLF